VGDKKTTPCSVTFSSLRLLCGGHLIQARGECTKAMGIQNVHRGVMPSNYRVPILGRAMMVRDEESAAQDASESLGSSPSRSRSPWRISLISCSMPPQFIFATKVP